MTDSIWPIVLNGDCRKVLPTLADESVQCCVTSPPYWGLRDYGTATWEGGDPDCDHRSPTMREGRNEDRAKLGGSEATTNSAQLLLAHRTGCGKCGAVKVDQQIGLEATPELFVATMVEVFREVRRILKKDGTCWLNLGDSYASSPPGNSTKGVSGKSGLNGINGASGKYRETLEAGHATKRDTSKIEGIKPKDLVGIPWMVAFALRADGWYLRQDIIWNKPNPMPESVTDRCTKAHEYIFLLSKSQRYYFDAAAIAEPATCDRMRGPAEHPDTVSTNGNGGLGLRPIGETRNKRSVWTVTTQPFSGAHFATFPPDLIKPCIKAGSRPGDTILDPFGGSGTTGMVALELGRRSTLIELNDDYIKLIEQRTAITPGLAL